MPAILADRHAPGAIEYAQKVTHDALIYAWGTKRRSGIWWVQRPGRSGRVLYTDLLERDLEPEEADLLANNPRAVVVVAFAIVAEGEPERRYEPGLVTPR